MLPYFHLLHESFLISSNSIVNQPTLPEICSIRIFWVCWLLMFSSNTLSGFTCNHYLLMTLNMMNICRVYTSWLHTVLMTVLFFIKHFAIAILIDVPNNNYHLSEGGNLCIAYSVYNQKIMIHIFSLLSFLHICFACVWESVLHAWNVTINFGESRILSESVIPKAHSINPTNSAAYDT